MSLASIVSPAGSAARTTRASSSRVRYAIAVLYLLTSTGCVSAFVGGRQVVPVHSGDVRAEVLVDGVSQGFTPIELTLRRDREYTVTIRAEWQERTVLLTPTVSGGKTALAAAPLGVTVVAGIAFAAQDNSDAGLAAAIAVIPLLIGGVVGGAAIIVDASTGALYDLNPRVIEVSFP